MFVERIPEVLALPTEQKELLAEELLNQVALEKEKDPAMLNLLRQRLAEHGADPAGGFHASFPMRPPRQPPLRRAKPTARFSAQDFRRRLRARAGDRVHGRARPFPFPAIPSPLRCFRRRCSWPETLARALRWRQGDEKARHRRLPAAGGQEIHIRQCTHGKSASAAFTTSR